MKFHVPGPPSIDVGPLDWTIKQGNRVICFWPGDDEASSDKKLIDMVTKKAIVDKENWLKFDVTILAKFGKTTHKLSS